MLDSEDFGRSMRGHVYFAAIALSLGVSSSARALTSATFNFEWTDRLGTTHPLVNTLVELWDQGGGPGGTDTFVGSNYSTPAGQLVLNTAYTRPDHGPLNIYVNVKADVRNVGRASDNLGNAPFLVRVPGNYMVPINGNAGDVVATVNNGSDGGKAIGFLQGMKVAHDYFDSMGASVYYVEAQFGASHGNGSFMSGSSMNVGYDSWGAWDVMFHEFSHGVADANGLDIQPHVGFAHAFNGDNIQNPAFSNLSPSAGTQLAYQEGIATFMGTSALRSRLPSAIPGMPGLDSNTAYDRVTSTGSTAPDNSISFSVDLENRSAFQGGFIPVVPGRGEGDELSVARILWDLQDDTPLEGYPRPGRTDHVALGAQGAYNLLEAAGASNKGRLVSVWRAARLAVGMTPESRAELGDIFEANAVSPIPGNAAGVVDGGVTADFQPLLAWTLQNGKTLGNPAATPPVAPRDSHSDRFEVAIYSADWSTLVLLSPELMNVTSWRVSSPLAEGTYNWVVIANSVLQSQVDFDDSYWSGAASFTISMPEPGLVAIVPVGLVLKRRRG